MSHEGSPEQSGLRFEIKRSVMNYLVRHPNAKDTEEGIRQWWLPDSMRELHSREIGLALEGLSETGWITIARFGGTTVYGLERTRLNEILSWLEN